ncbi:ATP-binding protein [Desulfonatronum lacustre]|uniref:ATP-binding protein n=1 Tax=Desulfonatronum lacustre TaxID=66849 RepID=UPI0004B12D1E|nr:ATP-binding protein [Desulfonatronum lacustre]
MLQKSSDDREQLLRYAQDLAVIVRREKEKNAALLKIVGDLEEARQKLLLEIEQRTALQRELEQAKEAAEEASQFKTDFMNNMSHELRTPLNGIMGMCSLLEMTSLDAEQRDFLALLKKSARRQLRLVDALLNVDLLNSDALQLELEEFDLAQAVRTTLAPLRDIADSKGLNFKIDLDKALPKIVSQDRTYLMQAVFNLVDNAVKFTAQGEIRVAVEVESRSNGHCLIRFTVRDTGIGISEASVGKIFRSFVQAERSYTRSFEGAGLGLSIARKILEKMGSEIQVDSEPGRGSTFSFSLNVPLGKADRSDRPPCDAQLLPSLRILVVEDEAVNRFLASHFLTNKGHAVTQAINGREAVTFCQEQGFDLILMDISMPVMDGLQATQAIRESRDFMVRPDIPIIALTGHVLPGDRERFLASGMDGYLGKPIDVPLLFEEINAVMRKCFSMARA